MRSWWIPALGLGAALIAVAAQPSSRLPSAQGAVRSTLHVVALGDSDTTGSGDPTGVGWVGRYAHLLRQRLGLTVTVKNLARDGKTSSALLADVRKDRATRSAVKRADILLLGIGGADLNAGDGRWEAGKCKGKACYAADLRAFGRNFESTVATLGKLRGSQKTVLRAITPPNGLTGAEDVIPPFLRPVATEIGVYQAETLRNTICATMTRHRGRCVDVLHAFNGPDGTQDAYTEGLMNHVDCCYPNAKGQQLIAQLLFKTGLKPLRYVPGRAGAEPVERVLA
jgi:lysophospholipase L1-like esterase